VEDGSGENACIVGVRLETWKRTSVQSWIVRSWIVHSLLSRWIKPRERPLVHADVYWVKGLPGLNGRREIRMHKLLLFEFRAVY